MAAAAAHQRWLRRTGAACTNSISTLGQIHFPAPPTNPQILIYVRKSAKEILISRHLECITPSIMDILSEPNIFDCEYNSQVSSHCVNSVWGKDWEMEVIKASTWDNSPGLVSWCRGCWGGETLQQETYFPITGQSDNNNRQKYKTYFYQEALPTVWRCKLGFFWLNLELLHWRHVQRSLVMPVFFYQID